MTPWLVQHGPQPGGQAELSRVTPTEKSSRTNVDAFDRWPLEDGRVEEEAEGGVEAEDAVGEPVGRGRLAYSDGVV